MPSLSLDDDNEDSMSAIESAIISRELTVSVPMLNADELEILFNEEIDSSDYSTDDDETEEEASLKRDQQRLKLLSEPNYGMILDFWSKFSTALNMKDYPMSRFEIDFLSERAEIHPKFLDLHLNLLKRVSSGKTIPKENFLPAITRFAYRFEETDGDHLENDGYVDAPIETKIRIVKNLLEKQFDRNQSFRNYLTNRTQLEIRSTPFGRDRFGAFYWLFMDKKCFIRIFREDVDRNRTWTNVVKNREELEKLIKILLSDHLVRKKFPDWKIKYGPFRNVQLSNEFEERFTPKINELDEDLQLTDDTNSTLSSASSVDLHPGKIKPKNVNLHPVINLNRQLTVLPPTPATSIAEIKSENPFESDTDEDSINSSIIDPNRRVSSCSSDENEEIESVTKIQFVPIPKEKNVETTGGLKRKLVDYDDTGSSSCEEKEAEKSEDLPIALRRKRRNRMNLNGETSSSSSSSSVASIRRVESFSSRKSSKSRKAIDRRPTKKSSNKKFVKRKSNRGNSSTSTDNGNLSDDESFFSDRENDNIDALIAQEQEENDDDQDEDFPRRTAKTLAKILENFPWKDAETEKMKCSRCRGNDKAEFLLICESCDEAFHTFCLQPVLPSIPENEWFCSFCEHKSLTENLLEKLTQLVHDQNFLQTKRRLTAHKKVKRQKTSAQIPQTKVAPISDLTKNLEEKSASKINQRRRIQMIISSDDDLDSSKLNLNSTPMKIEPNQIVEQPIVVQEKLDSNIETINLNAEQNPNTEQNLSQGDDPEKRQLRRRQTIDYRYDAFDSRIKEAIIESGIEKNRSDTDSDATEIMSESEKMAIQCLHDEFEKDFDGLPGSKDDDDFVPYVSKSFDEDSRTATKENNQENSSSNKKKRRREPKPKTNSNKTPRRKPTKKTDGETNILAENNLSNVATSNETNPAEPRKNDENQETPKEKPKRRRPPRKKKTAIQQESATDDETEIDIPKLTTNDETPPVNDEQSEKAAQNRRLSVSGRGNERRTILDHIKKLVGLEDDEENQQEINEQSEKNNHGADGYEYTISDDDDFPDEQEIAKTTQLCDLKKSLTTPKASVFRAQFMAPMSSYQFAMTDPTAHIDFHLIEEPSENTEPNSELQTETSVPNPEPS